MRVPFNATRNEIKPIASVTPLQAPLGLGASAKLQRTSPRSLLFTCRLGAIGTWILWLAIAGASAMPQALAASPIKPNQIVSKNGDDIIQATLAKPVFYISGTGKKFAVRYGQLADGSLNFVRITMPDGKPYTLPQVLSASGVRYTDERELVWWLHQDKARIDQRDANGEWKTIFQDLVELTKK